jgi:hypothetical protein
MRGSIKGVSRGHYRRYTTDQQLAALQDVGKHGQNKAARDHKIPIGTLGYWIKKAKVK